MKLFNCFKKDTQYDLDIKLFNYVYERNYNKVIKIIKKGANVNSIISYLKPIDIACHNEDLQMIRILIYYGSLIPELSRMFCYDCRKNFNYMCEIYKCYKILLKKYLKQIFFKYKIPPGVDNYLSEFLL